MRIVVVGSGATGVHFALTALEMGHQVDMIDVGYERPAAELPDVAFPDLAERLPDPAAFFLGMQGERVVYPPSTSKLYEFPPSKDYVFRQPAGFRVERNGFAPVFSFARGGLAEAWTGGCYEYSDADLENFPFRYADMADGYATVAQRIGISAARDELLRFSPMGTDYLPPLDLDPHSARLYSAYERHRPAMNRLGFYLGRSRLATLSRDLDGRRACDQRGRCLWGCPSESIYAPSYTLRTCARFATFRYHAGRLASHFTYDAGGVIGSLVTRREGEGDVESWTGDCYVLAAGALGSSKLYLDSIFRRTGAVERLAGLLDSRMVMVPFLTPGQMGRPADTASYQFHLLALGLEARSIAESAHGQITTLKAAQLHPIVQTLPLDLRSSLGVFQAIRGGLGVVNLWLHDRRDPANLLTLRPLDGVETALRIEYHPAEWQDRHERWALRALGRGLRRLGALVPPGMTRHLPPGASIHYGGTLPMTSAGGPHTLTPDGRSRTFRNLLVVDGAGFPFLSAKNHTFTMMANAVRIARSTLREAACAA